MKSLVQISLMIVFVFGTLSCENDDLSECVTGKVIGYDRCNNVTLIQILSGNLRGESIELFEQEFNNLVQYPNISSSEKYPPLIVQNDSIFYFKYRYFDSEKDEYPVDDDFCTANKGPFELPTIVIINHSIFNCP